MKRGEYMVVWHAIMPKKAKDKFKLFGKKIKLKLRPMVHRYETEEIAQYGYDMLKSRGCHRPLLLKVIRE